MSDALRTAPALAYASLALAVGLALATVPLARAGAPPRAWRLHALAALLLAGATATALYFVADRLMPWMQLTAGFALSRVVPVLTATVLVRRLAASRRVSGAVPLAAAALLAFAATAAALGPLTTRLVPMALLELIP